MKIIVNENFFLERTLNATPAGSSVLVEIVTQQDGKPVTGAGCAEFLIYTNHPEHNAFMEESDRSKMVIWDGDRLPESVEQEMATAIRDAFEISFAEIKKIFEARGDDTFEVHVGRICFPRKSLFIPRWVELSDGHRILIKTHEHYPAGSAPNPSTDNFLVLDQLRRKCGDGDAPDGQSNDDLEVIAYAYIGFEFQSLVLEEWVTTNSLDEALAPLLPLIRGKFMKAFMDSDHPAFEKDPYSIGDYYCIRDLTFRFVDKEVSMKAPKIFPIIGFK